MGRPKNTDKPEEPKKRGKTGPKPTLTKSQLIEAQRLILSGEMSLRGAARYFKVAPATLIRAGISENVKIVKAIAAEVVEVEAKVAALPLALQVTVTQLVKELQAVSINLVGAAKYGAMTAHRMSQLAHDETEKIDPAASAAGDIDAMQQNRASLNTISALTEVANESAKIGLNLLAANKTMLEKAGDAQDITPEDVPDDAMEASAMYRRLVRGDV